MPPPHTIASFFPSSDSLLLGLFTHSPSLLFVPQPLPTFLFLLPPTCFFPEPISQPFSLIGLSITTVLPKVMLSEGCSLFLKPGL